MEDERNRIRPLSATIDPEGTIEVELFVPGYGEPQETTIEPTRASVWLAGTEKKTIDLDGEDKDSREAQRIIRGHIALIEREIERNRAREERRRQRGRAGV